jgi:hypothetical protein
MIFPDGHALKVEKRDIREQRVMDNLIDHRAGHHSFNMTGR